MYNNSKLKCIDLKEKKKFTGFPYFGNKSIFCILSNLNLDGKLSMGEEGDREQDEDEVDIEVWFEVRRNSCPLSDRPEPGRDERSKSPFRFIFQTSDMMVKIQIFRADFFYEVKDSFSTRLSITVVEETQNLSFSDILVKLDSQSDFRVHSSCLLIG